MSTTLSKTPALDELPTTGGLKVLEDSKYRRLALSLLASGLPKESVAERMCIRKVMLDKWLKLPNVDIEFRQLLRETQTTESAENLLRGSLVDSVLTLIKLRDDPFSDPRLSARIAMYLIDRNQGPVKLGLADKDENFFLRAYKEGKNTSDAMDEDIKRLLASDPAAVAILEGSKTQTVSLKVELSSTRQS